MYRQNESLAPFRYVSVICFFLLLPLSTNSFAVSLEEKSVIYSNLLYTTAVFWDDLPPPSNEEITKAIFDSGIKSDNSKIGYLYRYIFWLITKEQRLGVHPEAPPTEEQWLALKEVNIPRYAAARSMYILIKYFRQEKRVSKTIPLLTKLKNELLETGNTEAIAIASAFLGADYSEVNIFKAIEEYTYSYPHLKQEDDNRKLETKYLSRYLVSKNIAALFSNLKFYSNALPFAYSLIDESLYKVNVSDFAYPIHALIGLNRFDESIQLAEKAITLANEKNDEHKLAHAIAFKVSILMHRYSSDDILILPELTRKAHDLIHSVPNAQFDFYYSYINLLYSAFNEQNESKFSEAVSAHIEDTKNRIRVYGDNRTLVENLYTLLSRIYELRGNYKESLIYLRKLEKAISLSNENSMIVWNPIELDPLKEDLEFLDLKSARIKAENNDLQLQNLQLRGFIFAIAATILLISTLWFINKNRALQSIAEKDSLTGALTRRAMFRAMDELFHKHTVSCVVLFDLDHFKQINDIHGHITGDEVLTKFSQLTLGRVRKSDKFCRYGGEEFLLALRNIELNEASELVNKIRDSLEAFTDWQTANTPLKVSFSAGIVEVRGRKDIMSVIEQCDELLYIAKDNGRGQNKVSRYID